MLHLLALPNVQQEIVERIGVGDDVLLQQGAVWSAYRGHAHNAKLLYLLAQNCQLYVLQEWLTVNGIAAANILTGVKIIDYPGFVELAVKNPVIHTWC